MVSNLFLS